MRGLWVVVALCLLAGAMPRATVAVPSTQAAHVDDSAPPELAAHARPKLMRLAVGAYVLPATSAVVEPPRAGVVVATPAVGARCFTWTPILRSRAPPVA